MEKKINVLCIDGGGIRGVIPGTILAHIESEIQKRTDKEARLADYFDLIAGTSTGGILTCAYLLADEHGRPKLSAQQAVDIYLQEGGKIFDLSVKQKIKSLSGLTDEKFSAEALEKALKDKFGDALLSELLKPCLLTSYNVQERQATFFNSVNAKDNPDYDFKVVDIARATSAAPTYFELAQIISKAGSKFPLIDGGVFANNPSMCAYAEARGLDFSEINKDPLKPNRPSGKNMFMVSIGTGSSEELFNPNKVKNWGMIEWVKPIIDIMMSGNTETVDYQLKALFGATDNERSYFRIEPSIHKASSEMDDASPKNLIHLKEAGLKYVEENSAQLDEIVTKLIQNK